MSSNLNLNVSGNSQTPISPNSAQFETSVNVNANVSLPSQIKDSVNQSEQPQGVINLAAYVANTSRPVLPKPVENILKKQDAVNRDFEGEHAAGTQAVQENTQLEQGTIEESLQAPEGEKKQKDDEGGQGGSSGGGGDSGQSDEFANQSLQDLVAQLSALEQSGKAGTFDKDQINALLSSFRQVKSSDEVSQAGVKETTKVDEPYPEFTIKGETVTGPKGDWTIPNPQTPPKSPSDVMVNTYHQLKGMTTELKQLIPQMPDSPEKITLANFLKTLVDALTKFQEYLYVMNNIDSKAIREKSQGQLETSLYKLEEQRKKQEEQERKAREAGEKQKTMGILGKVFGVVGIVMSVVLVVALCWTGPLAILAAAFMIASIASMITQQATGKGIFERAFTALGELVSALLDEMGIHGEANEWITLVSKIILVILVSLIVIVSNPIMFLFGGASNVVGFLQESGIINQFVEKCGGDEKAQMITSIVITSTIMVVTMIVSIAMMFIPGTQGALLAQVGAAVNNVTRVVTQTIMTVLQTVLKVTSQVAETVTKVLMQILKFLINPGFWATFTMMGLQTVDTVNKVKLNFLLADLARLQGEMTKMIEAADALIAIFKKIIQKLIEGLTETGTFISQTSDVLKKVFQGQSEALSNIWAQSTNA